MRYVCILMALILVGCAHTDMETRYGQTFSFEDAFDGDFDSFPWLNSEDFSGIVCGYGKDGAWDCTSVVDGIVYDDDQHSTMLQNDQWTGLIHDNIAKKRRSASGFNPLMHQNYP